MLSRFTLSTKMFTKEALLYFLVVLGTCYAGTPTLTTNQTENGTIFELSKDGKTLLTGTFGVGIDFLQNSTFNSTSFNVTKVNNGFEVLWMSSNLSFQAHDCFDLQIGKLNWYGGPQIYQQEWPIEKLKLSGNDPYVVRKDNNFAVPERYWLSSNGVFIFLDERSPLFIDQNSREQGKVCFIGKNEGPYINRDRVFLRYHLIALDDPVTAHKYALTTYLGQPLDLPNFNMVKEPIWTTWAKYKKHISDSIVREFAYDILDHGFNGQIEIDEQWETCFGSRVFMPDKFGNISAVIQDLHDKNFRVTLWAAPFVNPDCTDLIAEGEEKGYYVKNINGDMSTVWWESKDARQIDFTNAEARKWYSLKLKNLVQNRRIDGFKFDAGETDYVAQPAVYTNVDQELVPNLLTQKYIETVSDFGSLTEARSAFRTQSYNLFLRMIDKDSVWGLDDGLQSLVTTLLQLNMVGYNYVLPDMIGGNGYRAQPSLELLIRWTQATVFMPSMQFSYLPWDFRDDAKLNGTEIIRSMVKLHEQIYPFIYDAMVNAIMNQTPVNPPIWWIAPQDEIALKTNDEFLLGEGMYLIAPVMEEGATFRSVYLPNGTWVDGNDLNVTYTGPVTLNYTAPIDILPYFMKAP